MSVSYFAVVVLVGGAAEYPASGPELQDLQQQQPSQRTDAPLKKEAIPKQEKKLVHPLGVHLLQLLSDAMQLQHQAVHLKRAEEEVKWSCATTALEKSSLCLTGAKLKES